MFHTIVTHENPDLDAIFSSLLLRLFGEDKFPGVANAKMDFVSAGKLYQGKTSQQLLDEGIITVDTGGGMFDTHPDQNNKLDKSKLKRSATDLVAEHLGVLHHPEWKLLIEYTRIHDSTGVSLVSSDQIHHLTSIQSILHGIKLMYPNDNQKMIECGSSLLTSIAHYYVEDRTNDLPTLGKELAECTSAFLATKTNVSEKAKEKLRQWVQRIKDGEENAFSTKELDIAVGLRTMYIGASSKDEAFGRQILELCLNAILTRESRWYEAIEDVKQNAIIKKIGKAKICYIKSKNPLVIKATRFVEKADVTIFQDEPTNSITFMIRKYGQVRKGMFKYLVRSIRIAECVERNMKFSKRKVYEMGDAYHWFYHQSGNFIINGSAKAKIFSPSKIDIQDLLDLTYCEVALYNKVKENFAYPPTYALQINAFKLSNLQR